MAKYIKNSLSIVFIIIFASVMYGLTLRGVPGNPEPLTIKAQLQGDTKPMELSPERGRFAHVMALGDHGIYALPQVLADFVYPDVGYYGDKFYSYFAPGAAYLATPFYLLGKQYGLSQVFAFSSVSIFSILAMLFMYKIAREILELPRWASIAAPILFAFGSSAWSYGITLYQHHLTVFFFMVGFYAAWRYGKNTRWSWMWGFIPWVCYAGAFTVDYPNLLFLLTMMIYFFLQAWKINREDADFKISFRPSFILVSIGFILITAWHLNLNANNFGGWQKLAGGLPSYRSLKAHQEYEALSAATSTTIAIIKPVAPKEKNVIGFFTENRFPFGAYTLLVSTERGLLVFWPLIIPAFIGLFQAFKKRKSEVSALLGGVLANMFLYFSWGDPWGGWAFGPRYMILSISILSLFAAYWVSMNGSAVWRRLTIFILFAYSSAVSLLGALTTNAVPPKIEAIPLGAKYSYLRTFDFFQEGRSGSFIFNTYADQQMTLQQYGVLIYSALLLTLLILLFIIPAFNHDN